MRTTYGSPLFADARAGDRHPAGRAAARGGRDHHRQDEHAGVRRGLADVQRRLRRDAQPVRPERTSGGSSGGAAAAVASGMLPFADGSDLGASVRNPAAFCNVVGLRPSPGRVPDAGPGDAWNPLPVLGPMARTVRDVALLLTALAGPDRARPALDYEPCAFADARGSTARAAGRVERDLGGLPFEPEVLAVLASAAARAGVARVRRRGRRARPRGRRRGFEVLRGVPFAGAFEALLHQVKATLARTSARPRADARADRARAGAARRAVHRMRAFVERYDVFARPSPRSCRSPSSRSTRRRSPAWRWTATSSGSAAARGSPSRASRGRGPGGLHGRRAAGRAAARRPPGARRAAAARARLRRGDRALRAAPEL